MIKTLRVNKPSLLPETEIFFNNILTEKTTLEELVGAVIFIEYFAQSEDRSYLKSEYLLTLEKRFEHFDVGRFDLNKLLMHNLRDGNRAGIASTIMFYRGIPLYRDMQLMQLYRKRNQNKFLSISEKIADVYNEILNFYRHSSHHEQIVLLAKTSFGGMPIISRTVTTYVDICVTTIE